MATILCLDAGVVHPTPGEGPVDPDCPADVVFGAPREVPSPRAAISTNLAFGGANAAIVLTPYEEAAR